MRDRRAEWRRRGENGECFPQLWPKPPYRCRKARGGRNLGLSQSFACPVRGGDVRLVSRCRLRCEAGVGLIRFKGAQYPKPVILRAVLFHVRHALSYRDLEEIMAERGVTVDHAALNRWVVRYAPLIAAKIQAPQAVHGQIPAALSIWLSTRPPKISPLVFTSRGMASVCRITPPQARQTHQFQ